MLPQLEHLIVAVRIVRQIAQTRLGDEDIAVACQDQRGYADLIEPVGHVELLHQPKAVRHHALIGLPALPCDELEEGTGTLPTAKEVEEATVAGKLTLVDTALEPGARQARVGVEINNADNRLSPGKQATVVITP